MRVTFALVLLCSLLQGTTYKSGQILTIGAVLPSTCTSGDVFVKNTPVVGLYICASNAWVSSSGNSGTPTVSACGTSPSLAPGATNTAGIISVGTGVGVVTSCTLTFSAALAAAPACVAVASLPAVNTGVTTTPTTLTIVLSASLVGGKIHYHCDGR